MCAVGTKGAYILFLTFRCPNLEPHFLGFELIIITPINMSAASLFIRCHSCISVNYCAIGFSARSVLLSCYIYRRSALSGVHELQVVRIHKFKCEEEFPSPNFFGTGQFIFFPVTNRHSIVVVVFERSRVSFTSRRPAVLTGFRGFSQSHLANARILPYNIPRLFPSISLPIQH
jgi:hypothetical protein